MKSKIIVCTGGAKSGKSLFAETYALQQKGQKVYIATSQVYDEEMALKVERHKKRRGKEWINFEIPKDLSTAWTTYIDKGEVFLIDCVTMWATNYLMDYEDFNNRTIIEAVETVMMNDLKGVLHRISASEDKVFIFVTNELGLGIVPMNAMTRLYRELVGQANQYIASKADAVYMTISGITINLKELEVR